MYDTYGDARSMGYYGMYDYSAGTITFTLSSTAEKSFNNGVSKAKIYVYAMHNLATPIIQDLTICVNFDFLWVVPEMNTCTGSTFSSVNILNKVSTSSTITWKRNAIGTGTYSYPVSEGPT